MIGDAADPTPLRREEEEPQVHTSGFIRTVGYVEVRPERETVSEILQELRTAEVFDPLDAPQAPTAIHVRTSDVVKAHKPKWLWVWRHGVWTDEQVCSQCGLTREVTKAGEDQFDPHNLLEAAEVAS